MLKKVGVNVVWCVAFLLAVGVVTCPPLAGVGGGFLALAEAQGLPSTQIGGIDSYTKLVLHADGSDQGTSFTDSSSGAKTVSNNESYDSYTKLMLHMDNTLTDSAAGKTVTNNNVAFSSSAYKMGGYSGVFGGYSGSSTNNSFLSLLDSSDWNFGTGDFTIDFWVRFNSFPGGQYYVFASQYVDANNYFRFRYGSQGYIEARCIVGGVAVYDCSGNTAEGANTFLVNTWYHVALVRNGSNFNIYKNGTSIMSSTGQTGAHPDLAATFDIGYQTGFYAIDGYIDELRISKGIARWTSDFTPPSSPYGKVATVTSQKKFGTASGEFKGSGEYLSLADSDDWWFNNQDFTIECWFRTNSGSTRQGILCQRIDDNNLWRLEYDGVTPQFYFDEYSGGTEINLISSGSWQAVVNTWYHCAVVRSGNIYYLFINGNLLATSTNSLTQNNIGSVLYVGVSYRPTGIIDYFNGYLDELRISKGIARWTSNFTPPSAPYDVDTTPPTVSSTSPASSATGVGVSSAISATFSEDMDSSTITTSTFTLTSSSGSSVSGKVSYSNKVATFTPSNSLSYATTYTATITTGVKDISGNAMSSTYTWSFTTGSAPDTTAPSGTVSINSGDSYTNSTAVTLTLSATDNVGVVGYYLSTSVSTPTASASGWNSVTSATSYSGSVSYTLTTGDEQKTVYVWFKDATGNVSNAASDSITLDTTAPIVTITSPTSSDTYTATSNTVSLSGSASDTTSGVKEVTWSSDKGSSGTASGTTSWSISSVSLSTGDNKITVTAKDNAGNTSTDTITITYSAGKAPTVTTGSASNVTATQATLTGTVNANGLSTTAWFEYGTLPGTYGNKTTSQTVTGSNDTTVSITITGLTSGTTYYYRIAAQNNSGTSYGSEMSFQYATPGSAPTVTTESATDVTTTTATLNGKVNANGISTTAWFEYGAVQGSYGSKSNTKSVTGSTDTTVSASISGLTAGTTYYYRIAAQNSAGTSYGKEMSFYYSSEKKAPTVETEAATNVTTTSATLNGKCNPNGLSTTAWFEYGTLQGTYDYKTDTQSMSGSSYTKVSASITGLTAGTTYYYRIAAKNSVGTSYGTEMEFYKSPGGTDTTPTPTATPQPTLTPIPTQTTTPAPTTTPIPAGKGSISGDVKDGDGNVLQGVTVTIKGNSFTDETETDADGRYEFTELAKGNYTLTYEKDGYQSFTKNVSLGEGEAKDLGSVTLETEGALGGIYGNVVDIKGDPIESVQIKLKGLKTKVTGTESSDADGYYEFTGLGADTYVITAKKKRYRKFKQTVTLGEGEEKEVEIEMRKTTKKIKGLIEDNQ